MGWASQNDAVEAITLGDTATADSAATYGIAIGSSSRVRDGHSLAVGFQTLANAERSAALGRQMETYQYGEEKSAFVPIIGREAGWFSHQTGPQQYLSKPAVVYSPTVDLGPGVPWSTATFKDNTVVVPASPSATEQFVLVMGYNDGTHYNTAAGTTNEITETGVEPTFVHASQGVSKVATNVDAASFWVYVDPEVGIDMSLNELGGIDGASDRMRFYPTRVGFICLDHATMTTQPFVSIGNDSSATAYVSNKEITGGGTSGSDQNRDFDGDNQIVTWPITDGKGISNIVFTLETPGVGASGMCIGRFFVEGYYASSLG
jgi:hypothetical protein